MGTLTQIGYNSIETHGTKNLAFCILYACIFNALTVFFITPKRALVKFLVLMTQENENTRP